MNRVLFLRTLRGARIRLVVLALGLFGWGLVTPLIYASFGRDLAAFAESNPFLSQFSQFGGGDLFSLSGSIALGFVHPISVALLAVIAVGVPVGAVAGERQRGTLEVLLARPLSRRSYFVTIFVAGALLLAALLAFALLGNLVSAAAVGVIDELRLANVPLVWFNGWLLFVAFMAVGFAASVSFDRLAPALGLTLAFMLAMYMIDVIASLWPDVSDIAPLSLFHYVEAKPILDTGQIDPFNVALLLGVSAIAVAYGLAVFPRRDLGAPS